MSKKKVLMVHNFYQIGGGEHTVFENEVEMLRENGHEVIEYTRSNDELKKSKLKLLLLPFTTIWSFKTYRDVKKIIRNRKIDIVHCHNTFPLISPSVYYAARSEKVPVVQTIHNFRFLCPCGIFYRDGHICEECLKEKSFNSAVKHKCYRNSKIQTLVVSTMLNIHRKLGTYNKINYIFLTEFNKQKFSQLLDVNGDNVFVKPNFVRDFMKLTCEDEEENPIVFVSCLDENKGIKWLLEQWGKMPKKYKLHIYGVEPLEAYVKEEVQNIGNVSCFWGWAQEEMLGDIKKSMAIISPSLGNERYPMMIAESMAVGCPIVSVNIGNVADIVTESKAGLIYNPDKIEDFMMAINAVIKNNHELRHNAIVYYRDVLSKDKNYVKQTNIYEKLGGDTPKIFIFSGRLEENKGILSLLKMWKKLPMNYILHIYGTGSYKEFVEKVAKKNENIIYYGFQPREVILHDISQSKAVIIASEWYETFGMSIPESFSLSVPVITTDLGNPKLMVEEAKGGVTYKIDDFDSFFHAIIDIIDNNEFYSINAYLYYKEKLSEKINYESLSDIYGKSRII